MHAAQRRHMVARDLVPMTASSGSQIRGVWQLAWPSIVTFALQSVVGLIDLVFVSHLGTDVVAGVGIGSQLQFAALSLIAAIATGTVALVARATGAGDRPQAESVVRASLVLATGLGLVLMAAAPYCEAYVSLFGVESAVVAIGGSYLRILMFGGVPLAISIMFASAMRGAGDVRTPLLVGLVMNIANIIGDYMLIFGHWGAPELGADGSAVATAAAFTLAAAIYVALWLSHSLVLKPVALRARIDFGLCRRIARIGIPTCLEQFTFHAGLFLFVAVFSGFGTDVVSGYFIGVRVVAFSLIPGMGFQIAAATLVGQHLGAGHPEAAARAGWRATLGAACTMSAIGLMIALRAATIVTWFGSVSAAAESMAVTFLMIVCTAQPLMALEFGVGGSLRGAGDTRVPLVATLLGLFVFRLGGALVVIHVFGGTIAAVWMCLLADYATKGAILAERFRRGRWKTRSI
ncbi:MAG: MATE family efflux transporter [Myxococcota bacterium]